MLTMGFAEEVDRILSETPEYKQVALFSATMPPAIRKLTAKYLHDPLEVSTKAKTTTAENISQRYIQVAGPRKMDALTRVLEVEPFEAMIVFVRTKQATEEVAERLRRAASRRPRSTGTSRRASVSGPSPPSRTAASTSWSPPTWPPAAWTSNGSHTCSTTTSRTTPSPTCTGSGAPAGRDAREPRCCSSPRENATCSRPLRRRPASRSPKPSCPPSRTSTPSGWPSSPTPSPPRSALPASICSASWFRTTNASTTSRWPISPPRWPCSHATARSS